MMLDPISPSLPIKTIAVTWMTTHKWGQVLEPTLYSSNGHAFTAVDSRN